MKKIMLILICGLNAYAASTAADQTEEKYTPPEKLTRSEVSSIKVKLIKRDGDLKKHWQTRLAMAKNRKALLENTGYLNKPYYGDNGGAAKK